MRCRLRQACPNEIAQAQRVHATRQSGVLRGQWRASAMCSSAKATRTRHLQQSLSGDSSSSSSSAHAVHRVRVQGTHDQVRGLQKLLCVQCRQLQCFDGMTPQALYIILAFLAPWRKISVAVQPRFNPTGNNFSLIQIEQAYIIIKQNFIKINKFSYISFI